MAREKKETEPKKERIKKNIAKQIKINSISNEARTRGRKLNEQSAK